MPPDPLAPRALGARFFFVFFYVFFKFYYMCIPLNITTFVFKKNNRIQYITRKEK